MFWTGFLIGIAVWLDQAYSEFASAVRTHCQSLVRAARRASGL
jgi:hypothetical protein